MTNILLVKKEKTIYNFKDKISLILHDGGPHHTEAINYFRKKSSIVDFRLGSKYGSERSSAGKLLSKKLHEKLKRYLWSNFIIFIFPVKVK